MRPAHYALMTLMFAVAAVLSLGVALKAADVVEEYSRLAVEQALVDEGLDWADADAEGLRVILIGTAPSEAERFRALSVAGTVVDAPRIIDRIEVVAAPKPAAPDFSVEILRNEAGVTLIGLVPAETDRAELVERIRRMTRDERVSDFLQAADYPEPGDWRAAVDYATLALQLLPRSKISVEPGRVRLEAMADSDEARRALMEELRRKIPPGVEAALDIRAPLPVVTPFTVRFVIDDKGARLDACTAEDAAAAKRILDAAERAGLPADQRRCRVALGVPTPRWSEAAVKAIDALARLGRGSVTLTDADISLVAADGTDPAVFDEVAGQLQGDLPDVFDLHAVLPRPPQETAIEPVAVTALLGEDGTVRISGRVGDDRARAAIDSVARAAFGATRVTNELRGAEQVPPGWTVRVAAALEALARLSQGRAEVTGKKVVVEGVTGARSASDEIAQILSVRLGEGADFAIDVTYDESLDPLLKVPSPEECEARIAEIQAGRKIAFEPGKADVAPESGEVLDQIAQVLKECGDVPFEIAGHTDSQGREIMNQQLSQARADMVLAELRKRRVRAPRLFPRGYGESQPIADNGTEEGREMNRRIEFRLLEGDEAARDAARADAAEPVSDPADADDAGEKGEETQAEGAAGVDGGTAAPQGEAAPGDGEEAEGEGEGGQD